MRIMGLDFGTKTVGVAISDELGITAQPIQVTSIFKGDKSYFRILLVIVGGIDNDILVMRKTCCKKQPGITNICCYGINIGRSEHRVSTEIILSLQNKRIWYKYSVNLITFVVERKRLTLRQVNKGNYRTTSPFSAYDLSE